MIDLDDDSSTTPSRDVQSTGVAAVRRTQPRFTGRVLLASARRTLVAWFQVALASAGLSLAVSPDGLHALLSAVRSPPELVILDDDLAGVDANRVEELLGRDARTATARVVRVRSLLDTPAVGDDDALDHTSHRLPAAHA
ncbi:MAG: hypothetical protein PVJ57_18430 [Phycisphaerae bacterium]|jgi:hypothetical protein